LDDIQKKLDMALAKIAALEAAKEQPKKAATFDPRRMEADPVGHMAELGLSVDHVTRILVANAMGDQAPQHLKDYAEQGKKTSAVQSALEAKIEALAGAVNQVVGGAKRESFKTLASDKSKYPHLAAAFAVDPDQFSDVQGDPAEIAAQLEGKYAKFAEALGAKPQPASAVAAVSSAQGSQATPATASALQGTPPPITPQQPGPVSDDIYAKLKQEVVSTYEGKTP
jgi:hypothetical protein